MINVYLSPVATENPNISQCPKFELTETEYKLIVLDWLKRFGTDESIMAHLKKEAKEYDDYQPELVGEYDPNPLKLIP